MAEEYITQVSAEIGGRVTKKISQNFSRTESCILGALSKIDEFLLNPQLRTCSVAVRGTSRNNNSENREPTGDRSLNDPCLEVEFSASRISKLTESDQEEIHHNIPRFPSEIIFLNERTQFLFFKIEIELMQFLERINALFEAPEITFVAAM